MELDVVGAAEARGILGVELQRISRWRRTGRLPEPYADLACGPVWLRADIEKVATEDPDPVFTEPPDPPDLMGTSEVAKRLGVDKSQVARWQTNGRSRSGVALPDPCARIKAGPIWRREDIEAYVSHREAAAA